LKVCIKTIKKEKEYYMNNNIINKIGLQTELAFERVVSNHLDELFSVPLLERLGEIEFRIFNPCSRMYFKSIKKAFKTSKKLFLNNVKNIFYGINPRSSRTGTINDIQYVTTFHASVPYDSPFNNRSSNYKSPEEAIKFIDNYQYPPTKWIRTPEEIQCFWKLNTPLEVFDVGYQILTDINEALAKELNGDINFCGIDEYMKILYFRDEYEEEHSEIIAQFKCINYDFSDLIKLI
jgi:hypothetical protein